MLFLTLMMCLIGAVLGIAVADSKGRGSCGMVLLCILVPIVGLIVAVVISPDEELARRRALEKGKVVECEACKSLIHPDATICPQCRTERSFNDRAAQK